MSHFPEFFGCKLPIWMLQVLEWFDKELIDGYLLHDIIFWLQKEGIVKCSIILESSV